MKKIVSVLVCVGFMISCHQENEKKFRPCPATVFTTLPVDINSIHKVSPLGVVNPPAHTLPTDHVYFYMNEMGMDVKAPGALMITQVRKSTYASSGLSDYSIDFKICGHLTGRLGHITALADELNSQLNFSKCTSYFTGAETVEQCKANVNIEMNAGELIGKGGPSIDFGVYDAGVKNYFISPNRFQALTLTAVCPYNYFSDENRTLLFSKLDVEKNNPAENDMCVGVEVDIDKTAQGIWTLKSNPVTKGSDESYFATLAPNPHNTDEELLAFGLPSLIAGSPLIFDPQTTGSINRSFKTVVPDGKMYCYVSDASQSLHSYFLRLGPDNVLTVEMIEHSANNSPCNKPSSEWVFSSEAEKYIR